MSTARQLVRRVAVRLYGDDIGCSDGSCLYGHPGGLQTNGGCSCLKEHNPAVMRQHAMRLAAIAKVLAAVAGDDENAAWCAGYEHGLEDCVK